MPMHWALCATVFVHVRFHAIVLKLKYKKHTFNSFP